MELVVRATGEVVSLEDPVQCARALASIRELEADLREAKAALTDALAYEFERQGSKTLNLGAVKAELRGGTELVWDIEILETLLDAGLPKERFEQLVQAEVSYRVNQAVAKQLEAANVRYGDIIARARTVREKQAYVTVKPL